MKKKIIILSLFVGIISAFRQSENRPILTMKAPDGWIKINNEVLYDNLGNFILNQKQLDILISDNQNSILLYSYIKYKQAEHAGLIPTIVVKIRSQKPRSYHEFYEAMIRNSDGMKRVLPDLQYIDKAQKVIVGGRESVYFSVKFSMKTSEGTIYPRSKAYSIPDGNRYFQITFTDGEEEDCSALFESLVKTVSFQ